MSKGKAYKQSYTGYTMRIKIIENGRIVDNISVADTVALREVMTKYSLRSGKAKV